MDIDWRSPEAEAWARGFSYKDYKRIICNAMQVYFPISEKEYKAFTLLADKQMEKEIGHSN